VGTADNPTLLHRIYFVVHSQKVSVGFYKFWVHQNFSKNKKGNHKMAELN
jgi:hypothetical protein